MNVFSIILLAVCLIILLLRKHVQLGPSMLAGGLLLWLLKGAEPFVLLQALSDMLHKTRTYDLLAALYLVMCLEIELRTSGTLTRMVNYLQRIFSGSRITMVAMPAFLGLLPSLGGARFSAPIVEEAAKNLNLSPAHKSAINYWFRHPFEVANPIVAGMIMACSIAQVPYSKFVVNVGWVTVFSFIFGWFFLMRPIKEQPLDKTQLQEDESSLIDLIIALSPILLTFFLVVIFNLLASEAMAIVVTFLFILLKVMGRTVSLTEVIVGAIDKKMFLNITCILYFIQLLEGTHVLAELVAAFRAAPLPVPVIIAALAFTVGILTGMSQAHVAIVMPIVAAVAPGNLTLAAIAMVFGIAGHMLTPTHMCLVVTLDYFQSDLFETLKLIFFPQVSVLAIFSLITYFIY